MRPMVMMMINNHQLIDSHTFRHFFQFAVIQRPNCGLSLSDSIWSLCWLILPRSAIKQLKRNIRLKMLEWYISINSRLGFSFEKKNFFFYLEWNFRWVSKFEMAQPFVAWSAMEHSVLVYNKQCLWSFIPGFQSVSPRTCQTVVECHPRETQDLFLFPKSLTSNTLYAKCHSFVWHKFFSINNLN